MTAYEQAVKAQDMMRLADRLTLETAQAIPASSGVRPHITLRFMVKDAVDPDGPRNGADPDLLDAIVWALKANDEKLLAIIRAQVAAVLDERRGAARAEAREILGELG